MKKKLSLQTIKVKSFITTLGSGTTNKIIGGKYEKTDPDICTKMGECAEDNPSNDNDCGNETKYYNCIKETILFCPKETQGVECA